MSRADLAALGLTVLLALGLRASGVTDLPFPWADETAHTLAAANYAADGQLVPDYWEHPPLRHLLLRGFQVVFGDGALGSRLRNVLFGALAAALTFLFAREVGGDRRAALLAGLLLATDPLHVVMSRFTWEEIYGGALFLAALLAWMTHRGRSHRLALAGLLMGCALATKWYYVPCWLLVWPLTLWQGGRWRDPRAVALVTGAWILLPLGVYLLAYWPWFGRGYGLGELVEVTLNGYRSLQALTPEAFAGDTVYLAHTSAWEWFGGRVAVGDGSATGGGRGVLLLYLTSWPVWLLTLPGLAGLLVLAWRRRAPALALPAAFFLPSWGLLLAVDRPAFVYSAAPLLPFAFTAVAIAAVLLADRLHRHAWVALLAAALAWNGYLYPLATAREVELGRYQSILEDRGVQVR